ncbi:hypothetical protein ILP97_02635 [Amycolatopsis sp. H6(2020)]|nr:hypothetical protein [Amycolatopsis sp. H6(2020)]
MTIDLQHVEDVHDALDARSEDYAKFIPLFGGCDQFGFVTLQDDLEDQVESLGTHVVIVDRVQLAPAWRGLGGIGRLLTARLLRWVCNDPRLVAVLPFPINLDRALLKDNSIFERCGSWIPPTELITTPSFRSKRRLAYSAVH